MLPKIGDFVEFLVDIPPAAVISDGQVRCMIPAGTILVYEKHVPQINYLLMSYRPTGFLVGVPASVFQNTDMYRIISQ